MAETTRFVAMFDRHYGWEKRRVKGKLVTHPTHDQVLFDRVMKFIWDFKPDVIIDGGDGFNMSAVSRHNRGKPRLIEGFSLKREYDEAYKNQISPIEHYARNNEAKLVMLKGNHEYWIELLKDEYPQLDELIDPFEYLRLTDSDTPWRIVEYGGVYRIGKLWFTHGDNMRGASVYRAANLVRRYQKNIICGHFHTAESHVNTSLATEHPHIGMVAPMMGDPHNEYMMRAPSRAVQGFVYGFVQPNGEFNAYTVIATNRRFMAEGVYYNE